MTPVNDHLSLLERALTSMQGLVIAEHELPSALWLIAVIRAPVSQETINTHLERNAQAQSVAGYFLHGVAQLMKTAKSDLARAEASLYNGKRAAGTQGRHAKPPTQKALEMAVEADPKIAEHRALVIRLEYCRDMLKEVRDTVTSRSRHLEQISNNLRLEGRIDSAV